MIGVALFVQKLSGWRGFSTEELCIPFVVCNYRGTGGHSNQDKIRYHKTNIFQYFYKAHVVLITMFPGNRFVVYLNHGTVLIR